MLDDKLLDLWIGRVMNRLPCLENIVEFEEFVSSDLDGFSKCSTRSVSIHILLEQTAARATGLVLAHSVMSS